MWGENITFRLGANSSLPPRGNTSVSHSLRLSPSPDLCLRHLFLLWRQKALHFLLLSPRQPSTYHPVAAVIPHIRLAVSLCRLKSLKQPRTDRRAGEERRRWPRGFSNSVSSLTPSHQISVSFSLMRQFRPCSSTSFSGSVPLNLSSSSPLAVAPAHYLTRSDASTSPPSTLSVSSSIFSHLPSVCFPLYFCFLLQRPSWSLTLLRQVPRGAQQKSLNSTKMRKCCTVSEYECVLIDVTGADGSGPWSSNNRIPVRLCHIYMDNKFYVAPTNESK